MNYFADADGGCDQQSMGEPVEQYATMYIGIKAMTIRISK